MMPNWPTEILDLSFTKLATQQVSLWTLIVLVLLFALSSWRTRSIVHNKLLLLLRSSAIVLLVAAWCGPYLPIPGAAARKLLLVDLSESMNQKQGQELLDRAREFVDSDTRVFAFASELREFRKLPTDFANWQQSFSAEERSVTSLEAALGELGRSTAANSEVLLISDANETKGNAISTISQLAQRVRIYPLISDRPPEQQESFKPVLISAPQLVPAGSKTKISVSVENTSRNNQQASLGLIINGQPLENQQIELAGETTKVFELESDQIKEGINEVRVVLDPDNAKYPTAELTVFISGQMREKVLLLSGTTEDAKHLSQALETQSYVIESYLAGKISTDLFTDLSPFSAILLNNIALPALPQAAALSIKNYVSSGGGLIMLGGNNSFGLGGYIGSPIEEILPVKLVPPRQEQRRLNTAVVLILDQSGSMKEQSRIEHSKAAAQAVVNGLKPDDLVGVIGFSSTPFELFPLAQVGPNRSRAMDRIQLMFPGATTNLMPALDLGRRRLEAAKAGRKHMIILTDGKLPDGIARRPYYLQTADQMRRSGVTLSTFLIGTEYDILLKDMAEVGGGAFYRTNSLSNLPRLFLEDIRVSTGDKTQREGQRYDVKAGKSGILSTELRSFPTLLGYVETRERPEAQLELTAYANRNADPLLASWSFGSGRVLAYTSDVSGRWSNMWVSWPNFLKFWSNLLDSAMQREKASDTPHFEINHYLEGNSLKIESTIYSELNSSDLKLELETPGGTKEPLTLTSLASGHYLSSFAEPLAGNYTLQLYARGTRLTPIRLAIAASELGEVPNSEFNRELLSELALRTGGRVNPNPADIDGATQQPPLKHNLDHIFIIAALILVLLEIALRELYRFRLAPV